MVVPRNLPRAWSEAIDQLRRDVSSVRRRLAGQRPSPVVRAGKLRVVPPTAHAAPREFVVDRVVPEARDVVTLVLRDPRGAPFAFEAGQFFTVLASIDGETVPRNYSASNAPGTSELHLTIKRKEGGRASGAISSTRPGDVLPVLGPFGSFVAGAPSGAARTLVLVAGGVGITPLLSIARAVLATEPASRVKLVYGNRSREDVAFAGELAALSRANGDRFVVRHVLEADDASDLERASFGRRLDRDTCRAIFGEIAERATPSATYFVCGPDAMRDEVLAAIAQHDPRAVVKTERFTTKTTRSPGEGTRALTIRVSGKEHRAVVLAGATILDGGLSAGAPMPSSCAMGGCGACRVKLISGDVEMDEPNCLGDAERREGYVLACVGRPSGPCVIEVEDTN